MRRYTWHEMDEAMKEGRLVILPCRIGTTVYYLDSDDLEEEPVYVVEDSVKEFLVQEEGPVLIGTGDGCFDAIDGEDVFLDNEAAKRAAERRRQDAAKLF